MIKSSAVPGEEWGGGSGGEGGLEGTAEMADN